MGEKGTGMGVGPIDGTNAPDVVLGTGNGTGIGLGAATVNGLGDCPAIGVGCAHIGDEIRPATIEELSARRNVPRFENDFKDWFNIK